MAKRLLRETGALLRDLLFRYRIPIFFFGTGLIVYYLFSQISLQSFTTVLTHADWRLVPVIVLLILLMLAVKALRWRYLLMGIKPCAYSELYHATVIGHVMNLLLPINIGEFIRGHYLSQRADIALSSVYGNIVLEKVLDGVFLVLLMGIAIWLFPQARQGPYLIGIIVLTVVLLALGLLLSLLRSRQQTMERIVFRALSYVMPASALEKLKNGVQGFFEGQKIGKGQFLAIFLLSVLMRVFSILAAWVSGLAFGINIGLLPFLFVDLLSGLAASAGHVVGIAGAFEAAAVLGLSLFGVAAEPALSMAILQTATYGIALVLIGLHLWLVRRQAIIDYLSSWKKLFG